MSGFDLPVQPSRASLNESNLTTTSQTLFGSASSHTSPLLPSAHLPFLLKVFLCDLNPSTHPYVTHIPDALIQLIADYASCDDEYRSEVVAATSQQRWLTLARGRNAIAEATLDDSRGEHTYAELRRRLALEWVQLDTLLVEARTWMSSHHQSRWVQEVLERDCIAGDDHSRSAAEIAEQCDAATLLSQFLWQTRDAPADSLPERLRALRTGKVGRDLALRTSRLSGGEHGALALHDWLSTLQEFDDYSMSGYVGLAVTVCPRTGRLIATEATNTSKLREGEYQNMLERMKALKPPPFTSSEFI